MGRGWTARCRTEATIIKRCGLALHIQPFFAKRMCYCDGKGQWYPFETICHLGMACSSPLRRENAWEEHVRHIQKDGRSLVAGFAMNAPRANASVLENADCIARIQGRGGVSRWINI